MKFNLARQPSPEWQACAALVRERYARYFGADVQPRCDAFVVGHSGAGTAGTVPDEDIAACAGVTFASEQPFFSERYLDTSIEDHAHLLFGVRPERHHIVEIGPLASRHDGSGKELVRLTPVIMWCLGMRYIMCTATAPLIDMFRAVKVPFAGIRPASVDRLAPEERARWGRYYDQRPIIGLIPLNGIAPLFSEITGRYAFADPVVTMPRLAGVALGG